jgi:hypothetical protein
MDYSESGGKQSVGRVHNACIAKRSAIVLRARQCMLFHASLSLPMRAMRNVRLATDDKTGALVCRRKNKASKN